MTQETLQRANYLIELYSECNLESSHISNVVDSWTGFGCENVSLMDMLNELSSDKYDYENKLKQELLVLAEKRMTELDKMSDRCYKEFKRLK